MPPTVSMLQFPNLEVNALVLFCFWFAQTSIDQSFYYFQLFQFALKQNAHTHKMWRSWGRYSILQSHINFCISPRARLKQNNLARVLQSWRMKKKQQFPFWLLHILESKKKSTTTCHKCSFWKGEGPLILSLVLWMKYQSNMYNTGNLL